MWREYVKHMISLVPFHSKLSFGRFGYSQQAFSLKKNLNKQELMSSCKLDLYFATHRPEYFFATRKWTDVLVGSRFFLAAFVLGLFLALFPSAVPTSLPRPSACRPVVGWSFRREGGTGH